MTTECVLAIDLGTGGPKVALVAADGSTVAWSSRPVATRFIDGGGAEQDPHEMWRAIVEATRATLEASRPTPPIVAVAVTSQYMSQIPVAADGMPTGPCILWMDTRGAQHNRTLLNEETFALFVERHGLIPLPNGNDNGGHIHVLRTFHPQSYAAAVAFLEPMDYINARLTGSVSATQSTVFGQLVCDNRTWGLTEYDPVLVAATRLDPDKLAPLLPMNGIVGTVTRVAAVELGITAGLPVTTGTIDSITSAIGAGALTAGDGSIIVGTTSVMVTHIEEFRGDLRSSLLAVPSPLVGKYFVMAENGVGGRALEWAMRPAGEAFVGNEFTSVRFGGGAAQSDLWAQMMADALDRPVHRLDETRATNARVAAFLAFAALGHLSIDDVPSLLRTRAVREPDPGIRAAMDAALQRLIELHRALANLTKF